MTKGGLRWIGTFGAVVLASGLVSNTSIAAAPAHCDVRLTVELTPDVPADGRPADLVIVSLYMPKQGGVQLVREIQAMYPGAPLIAISGQFLPGLSAGGAIAHALGVQQVIAKPLTRSDLLAAVRAIIRMPG